MMVLDVVGVDILCVNCGLLVMEVNVLLGLEGIEKIIGIDIVGKMICWIECYVMIEYCLKMGG